jgi:hypothetical protein
MHSHGIYLEDAIWWSRITTKRTKLISKQSIVMRVTQPFGVPLVYCIIKSINTVMRLMLTAEPFDLTHILAKFGTTWVPCMNHVIIKYKMLWTHISARLN